MSQQRREPAEGEWRPPRLGGIDHVIYVARDVDVAAERIFTEHGLASVEWPWDGADAIGMANRMIPLGDAYIEIMGIADPSAAERIPFGRFLLRFAEGGHRLLAWGIRTDDMAQVGRMIGSTPERWTNRFTDDPALRWRAAGMDGALADRSLPFFIEWDGDPDEHPGRLDAMHRCAPVGITNIEIAGNKSKIRRRTASAELPISIVDGEPGPVSVTVATSCGDVVLF